MEKKLQDTTWGSHTKIVEEGATSGVDQEVTCEIINQLLDLQYPMGAMSEGGENLGHEGVRVCNSGLQAVQFDQIMRWWCSYLGQGLLQPQAP